MRGFNNYKRLESCSKEELIEMCIKEDRRNRRREAKYMKLEEENQTLKDNVEFLHSCLDDRDKSIAIMQEENKELKEVCNLLRLCIDDVMKKAGIENIQINVDGGKYCYVRSDLKPRFILDE